MSVKREPNDKLECAYIEMKGAITRLLMVLDHRSEHNYQLAMEVAGRKVAEYRALKHQPVDA